MSPSEKQLTLGNPYGRVSEAEVSRLLGSAAVMLIYPSDVLQRCPPPADEVQAMRAEPRWRALDVAGQVERLMASRDHGSMDRVAIPASYLPGITIVCAAGSEASRLLPDATSPWSAAEHQPI